MSQRKTVLVAGSANLDFVVRAAHVPAPGETVLGRDFTTFPGGKGANQAIACARAGGAPTRMLLALGNDAFATPIEASLRTAGVDLDIVRIDQPTGTAFICVSDDAENAITVAPGANAALTPGHLPKLEGVAYLLLQLETPMETVSEYARAARAAGVTVALNAAPAQALPESLLSSLDILIVNEGELSAITHVHGDIGIALAKLSVPTVVVTLGARGVCARVRDQIILQPGFVVEAVDTTAAGDTFCGAYVAALGSDLSAADALRRASAAAALACTRMGAQASIPTHSMTDEFLQAQPADDAAAVRSLGEYCGVGVR